MISPRKYIFHTPCSLGSQTRISASPRSLNPALHLQPRPVPQRSSSPCSFLAPCSLTLPRRTARSMTELIIDTSQSREIWTTLEFDTPAPSVRRCRVQVPLLARHQLLCDARVPPTVEAVKPRPSCGKRPSYNLLGGSTVVNQRKAVWIASRRVLITIDLRSPQTLRPGPLSAPRLLALRSRGAGNVSEACRD